MTRQARSAPSFLRHKFLPSLPSSPHLQLLKLMNSYTPYGWSVPADGTHNHHYVALPSPHFSGAPHLFPGNDDAQYLQPFPKESYYPHPPQPVSPPYSHPATSSGSELESSTESFELEPPEEKPVVVGTPPAERPARASSFDDVNVQPFVAKLAFLLTKDEYSDIISWDEAGTAFVVAHNSNRFKTEVLPKFFAHQNPASFTRQLNVYSFTRLPVPDMLERVALMDAASYTDVSAWRHPAFCRGASKLQLSIMSPRPARPRNQGTIKAKRRGTVKEVSGSGSGTSKRR